MFKYSVNHYKPDAVILSGVVSPGKNCGSSNDFRSIQNRLIQGKRTT